MARANTMPIMASRAVRPTLLSALIALALVLPARRAAPEPALLRLGVAPPPPDPLETATGAPKPSAEWAKELEPLVVRNVNTEAEAVIRLYEEDGALDASAERVFSQVACDGPRGGKLHTRVIQLAVKAAYHFHASKLVIISAYRPMRRGKGGYHALGRAIDFQLPGVDYRKLASYLRSFPRAGVGVYTNPGTRFVHLDAREQSYHWLDASPPGVTWREKVIADAKREDRDAAYTPESDLPLQDTTP